MGRENLGQIMVIVAIATPLAAALLWMAMNASAKAAETPLNPRLKGKMTVLALAGPVNALAWLLFNGWLERMGPGSVAGYALAALTFMGVGLATGLFSRRRGGRQ